MYHSFLIHSFADGHLGSFQLWLLLRKGNPSALLVGMQTGGDTVENSVEFPQKTKRELTFDSAIPLLGWLYTNNPKFRRTYAPQCL